MGEDHRVEQPEAFRQPGRRQKRERREQIGAEEQRAQHFEVGSEAQVEEERQQRLRDQPTGEGVDAEERRQPEHDTARVGQRRYHTPPETTPFGQRSAGRLDGGRKTRRLDRHDHRHQRIQAKHERQQGIEGQATARQQRGQPGDQRATGAGDGGDEIIARESRRAFGARPPRPKHRLLDGQEGRGLRG